MHEVPSQPLNIRALGQELIERNPAVHQHMRDIAASAQLQDNVPITEAEQALFQRTITLVQNLLTFNAERYPVLLGQLRSADISDTERDILGGLLISIPLLRS